METTRPLDGKYLRLVYCLIETCSKSARRLLFFYLERSRPGDFQGRTWSIDAFLYKNGERVPKLNPSQRAILFPGYGIETDVSKWDISLLFMILEMFDLDDKIAKDIMAIKKMRNKIFHAASSSIKDTKYEEYKQKVYVYVQNCCAFLDDETLAKEIERIFQEADEKEMNEEDNNHMMSHFDNWFKSDPLFVCIDRFPADIGSIMDVLFQQITDLLRNYRFKIPDAYLSLQISRCNPGISEVVSDQILKHLCEKSSQQGESELGKAISGAKRALTEKQRKLVEIRKGCLILRIQSENFKAFWRLISDCISGKLTSSWSDAQAILRKEHGAPYLMIEVGVTASEITSCAEELVQNISKCIGNEEQIGYDNEEARSDRSSGAMIKYDDYSRWFFRTRREGTQEITTNTEKDKRKTYGKRRVWDESNRLPPIDAISRRLNLRKNIEMDRRKVFTNNSLPPVSDNEGWSSERNASRVHRIPNLSLSTGHRWVDFTSKSARF